MVEEYDKLVRDGVPRVVRENGEEPITHEVSGAEYRDRLHEKLDEEVAEFHAEPSAKELADVQAVLDALANAHDIDDAAVAAARREKAEERGEFEDGVVLEAVRR